MEVPWDDMHQPHSLLLQLLGYHANHSDMSITPLPQVILSSYLLLTLLRTIHNQQLT